MHCIGIGGSFDGAKCHGLTKEQCTELNGKTQKFGGTTWDSDLNQCVLKDAQKQADVDKFIEDLTTAAEFAITATGAALVILATGGAGAPLVIAAYTGSALALGGQIAEQGIKADIKTDMEAFKSVYDKCKQYTSEKDQHRCAYLVLNDFYAKIKAYASSNRLPDLFQDQYLKSLDEILDDTLGMIIPEELSIEDYAKLHKTMNTQDKSKLVQLQLAQGATITGDLILIVVGGVGKPKNATNLARIAKGANVVSKVSRSQKTVKVLSKLQDLRTAATDACKATPGLPYCPIN
jgi:hypothetical protein